MNIGIYTNCNKDKDLTVTSRLKKVLDAAGFNVFLHRDIIAANLQGNCFDERKPYKPFDLLLTVGGDGTILRIASYCALHGIAVLGINLGNVGFLTEIELNCIEQIPALINGGKLVKEYRSLLCTELNGKQVFALNEIVLTRYNADRMISVAVYVGGRLADKYYCDGYIVSTPTGSTAYSLSAGGSVISPLAKAFSLLPINSHSLHSRPIIIDDSDKVKIELLGSSEDCAVIADGQRIGEIKAGSNIEIAKADKQLVFLRLQDSNFYEKLLSKLNTWSVTLK